ncbi:glycosyltransferase [Methylophaga pinxianii]|uniref:glycosyltransferase n=1 Tax=Methylophaga pinxianii TaxID=2881052 RepID=UPI001CF37785|nr:glycosyltransferase [Methylophaga pinxianii]MCB2426632.1 glycosyltransferase [Methylophaga pinxianii]UPH45108.1 glycosyltransferase [Methylophaga pinxianii]
MKSLRLFPSVGYWQIQDKIFFDRKFYDGLVIYKDLWGGPFSVCLRKSKAPIPKFGLIEFVENSTLISFIFLANEQKLNVKHLLEADVILASADEYRNFVLSNLCRKQNLTCIYYIEYILETRYQINFLSNNSLLKKIKTSIWLFLIEFQRIAAITSASGLQANGMPAFEAYGEKYKEKSRALLYFDSRNTEDMLIQSKELEKRLTYLTKNKPIRLAFSGRISAMKGADDLIELARVLANKNIAFHLDIFGDGDLNQYVLDALKDPQLDTLVEFHGAVDYQTVLVPFIQENVDVFICCHKQSDPSCTYLETYSCGVPILGYDNKAHSGILKIADIGWQVPLGNIEALANKLIQIDLDRNELKEKSIKAVEFARLHTFENTFRNRIEQCREMVSHHV